MKKEKTNINAFDKAIISWEAPEYIQHEKGLMWFIIAGIMAILFAVYAVMVENWTFAVAIVILSAVYVWQHFFTPQHIKIIISKVGVKVGEKKYPYQNIESFWVLFHPPHVKTFNIRSNSRFLPDVAIDLDDQDPTELREYLCTQIREVEGKEESFTEVLIRIFKM